MMSTAAKSFCVTLAVFVAHRALSFTLLLGAEDASASAQAAAFFVGLLSDLWIAYLAGFVAASLGLLAALVGQARLARHTWLLVTAVVGGAVCAHQSYVDFFHFQLMPFHLSYVLDPNFLFANGGSLMNGRGLVLLAVAIVMILVLAGRRMGDDLPLQRQLGAMAFATLVALGAHNRNIHLRVQWFIPEHLQMNAFERFHYSVVHTKTPERLSPEEWRTLASLLGVEPPPPPAMDIGADTQAMLRIITKPVTPTIPPSAVAQRIRDGFERRTSAGLKPLALIVLLESLRPSETGYFAPDLVSLTPNLDALSRRSITFTRALSTGSVTRGAQEALFCGYLGSRDTSLMRGRAALEIPCLPDLIRDGHAAGKRGDVFWFHGGEGRFDGQLAFWRARGVGRLLSLDDFAATVPRTGWGVSDRTFFADAARSVGELRAASTADFALGMLLSVTNHIPWDLPPDANLSAAARETALGHPSYFTTAYADAALGEFIEALRARDDWKDALVIIASDHGNNIPPYADLYDGSSIYGASDLKATWLQAHVNLILTGGLVDEALAETGVSSQKVDTLTSLTDVASFLGYVLGIEARVMGENPFSASRTVPVLADLEQGVFDPAAGRLFTRAEVVSPPEAAMPAGESRSLLYYRAFLQVINTWGRTQSAPASKPAKR